MKHVREMDQWEVYPSFYYSELSSSLKSHFNGGLFLLFVVFSFVFFIVQFLTFFSDIDLLISSRIEDVKLSKIDIESSDAYYGIRFYKYYNDSYINLNQSEIDKYFKMDFTLLTNNDTSGSLINYEMCSAEIFFDRLDWDDLSDSLKTTLNKSIKNYKCPSRNQSIFLEVNNFTHSSSYINIGISIREKNFKEALEFISKNNVYCQIIYSSYFINIKNRLQPFKSQIKYTDISLNPSFSKYFLIELSRHQIYDDVSHLTSNDYQLYKNKKLSYDTGSYYSFEEKYNEVTDIFTNRTIENLRLVSFYLSLSDKSKNIFRDFPKFTVFLAGTNSLIISIYAVFSIIGNFINSTFMNLAMTKKRMYSKEIFDFSKVLSKNEKLPLNKYDTFSKIKSNHIVLETPEKNHLESDNQQHSYDKKNELCHKNLEEKYLKNYFKQQINECHFYQVFLCCRHNNLREISLSSRMEKVLATLNIEKYFLIHDEFNLLKKILFEKDQLITFELISKLENSYYNDSKEDKPTPYEIVQSLQNIIKSEEQNNSKLKKYLINEHEKLELNI